MLLHSVDNEYVNKIFQRDDALRQQILRKQYFQLCYFRTVAGL